MSCSNASTLLACMLVFHGGCSQSRDYAKLLTELKSETPMVRANAACLLGRYYSQGTLDHAEGIPSTELVVDSLIANIDDEDEVVRLKTAEALGNIGSKAKPAVRALIRRLEKENTHRSYYLSAFQGIGRTAKEAIPIITSFANDNDGTVRASALSALSAVDRGSDATIDILTQALSDPQTGVRQRAATELGNQRPVRPMVIQALEKTVRMDNEHVGNSAKQALESIRSAKDTH